MVSVLPNDEYEIGAAKVTRPLHRGRDGRSAEPGEFARMISSDCPPLGTVLPGNSKSSTAEMHHEGHEEHEGFGSHAA
ncbi:MAG: hypothetical protein EA381_00295, partial [Planctomycetaceae bacterium]